MTTKHFEVGEFSSGFQLLHVASGLTHWLGDGTDVNVRDELKPGEDGFREHWEEMLNQNPEETAEAYFPDLDLDHLYTIKIEVDQDVSNPLEENDGMWTVYSFGMHLISDTDRDKFFKDDDYKKLRLEYANKMRVGLMFPLEYSSHGPQCLWTVLDDRGVLDRSHGFAIWEHKPGDMGAKTVADRRKDCESTLEEYTHWSNGNCHGYTITKVNEEEIDSCWGFIGDADVPHMLETIAGSLPEDATIENTKLEGPGTEYGNILEKIFALRKVNSILSLPDSEAEIETEEMETP
jgi:hypothetical protein